MLKHEPRRLDACRYLPTTGSMPAMRISALREVDVASGQHDRFANVFNARILQDGPDMNQRTSSTH